jgi:hypothetical protein
MIEFVAPTSVANVAPATTTAEATTAATTSQVTNAITTIEATTATTTTASVATVVPANLILNGGFELAAPHEAACGSWCLRSDLALIAPWTFSGQSNYELNFGVWPAKEGRISMDLSSVGPVTISQIVPTVVGKRYTVTFGLSSNACGSPDASRTGSIIATGASALAFSHKGGASTPWTTVNYDFFATKAQTTIFVKSTDESSCGPVVDNFTMIEFVAPTY